MTPDERTLLTRFLDDLNSAKAGVKDAEADALIGRALSSNPDAAYLLVQHAILSDQALHAAQDQVRDLQAQLQGRSQGSSFLGGGAQSGNPNMGGAYAPPQQPVASGPWAQPSYMQGGPGPFSGGSGLGGFLRQAGTVAAGVAGGEFLFSGLSHMFGGGYGGGYGGGQTVENVTINEYGDSSDDGDWSDDDGDDGGDDNS
ncbi:MAG: DUF2076 family protein [Proteobacteria bacterium]|nr:DUF2076 family protein [Pseudomonadota bacterium]